MQISYTSPKWRVYHLYSVKIAIAVTDYKFEMISKLKELGIVDVLYVILMSFRLDSSNWLIFTFRRRREALKIGIWGVYSRKRGWTLWNEFEIALNICELIRFANYSRWIGTTYSISRCKTRFGSCWGLWK